MPFMVHNNLEPNVIQHGEFTAEAGSSKTRAACTCTVVRKATWSGSILKIMYFEEICHI